MENLERLIKIVKLNDKFYHGCIPDYEIEYLIKYKKVDEHIIYKRLQDENLGIRITI